MASPKKTVRAHCNKCLGERLHDVVASKHKTYDERESDGTVTYWEINDYEMLECRGCENISLRLTTEMPNAPAPAVSYFPPAISRPKPQWTHNLEFAWSHRDLATLLNEVYEALHSGSNRLAMMGARTIVDMVMLDKVGDIGSFPQKLDAMQSKGFISEVNRDYLKAAIDAGSASAHRGYRPNDADLKRVIDIVENLLQAVYILGSAAEHLKKNTPPRKNPESKNKKSNAPGFDSSSPQGQVDGAK